MLPQRAVATSPDTREVEAAAAFDQWFAIVPADTQERLDDAYRLRYQVYCVENPFEDPAENPDGLETDVYDPHSVHSLLVYKPTGLVSGAVRLILPDPADLTDCFPIQHVCSPELLRSVEGLDLSRAAEISRFAVSKTFRRRVGEERYADVNWNDGKKGEFDDMRQLPYITLGLFRACLAMSNAHDISHVFAVMEPALIRLIRRFGLRFEPIGPLVDYHGKRQPCVANMENLVEMAAQHRTDCWLVGTDHGRLAVA